MNDESHTRARCNFKAAFRVTVRDRVLEISLARAFREIREPRSTSRREQLAAAIRRPTPRVVRPGCFISSDVRWGICQDEFPSEGALAFRNHRAENGYSRARASSRIPLLETRSLSGNANQSADPRRPRLWRILPQECHRVRRGTRITRITHSPRACDGETMQNGWLAG